MILNGLGDSLAWLSGWNGLCDSPVLLSGQSGLCYDSDGVLYFVSNYCVVHHNALHCRYRGVWCDDDHD